MNKLEIAVPLRTVILTTDFGLAAYKASRYAVVIAQRLGAKLTVAHSCTLSEAAMTVEVEGTKDSEQRRGLKKHLDALASELPGGEGDTLSLLLEGDPVKQIVELAQQCSPSLTVMGTHGGNALVRHILGSVAEGVLRSASTPVLTVGPHVVAPPLGVPAFHSILFVTDCTLESAYAAPYAISLAKAFGTQIEAMHVAQQDDVQNAEQMREVNWRLYEAFSKVVPDQAKDLCRPDTFIDSGSAKERILAKTREVAADLIVLGVKRNAHSGMLRTSLAFQLIIEADCPVVTVVNGPA